MLKEHGAQRPSVFEILQHVHNLRGTKSRFTYNIPVKEPLSPRSLQAPLQSLSPNIAANPLDELVSYKSHQSPAKNAGVEAREKVLEAIAPMRRGRPPQGHVSKVPSRTASPEKPVAFETKFGDDNDRAWKGLRPARSGLPSLGSDVAPLGSKADVDAWSVNSRQSAQKPDPTERRAFDNDFSSSFGSKFTAAQQSGRSSTTSKPVDSSSSGFGSGFGDAFDPSKQSPPTGSRPALPSQQPSRLRQSRIGKDAFDGLGLSAPPQPPTLGEARMSRTGLASFGGSSGSSATPYNLVPPAGSGLGTSNTTYRPPSAHPPRPTPSPQPQVQPQSTNLSPIPPPSQTWRQHVKAPSPSQEGLTAEERFPSLEDLDRTFGSPSPAEKPPVAPTRISDRPPSRSSYMSASGTGYGQSSNAPGVKGRFDGVRSQQVTGHAMRDARAPGSRQSTFLRSAESTTITKKEDGPSRPSQPLVNRPSLERKHRSSISMKTTAQQQELLSGTAGSYAPSLPPRPSPAPRAEPQDWLTGNDEDLGGPLGVRTTGLSISQQDQPVLRDSPSKRASFIERSPIALQRPLEAENVLPPPAPAPQTTELEREWGMALDRLDHIPAGKSEREKRKTGEQRRYAQEEKHRSKSPMSTKAFITRNDVSTAGLGLQIRSGTGADPRQSKTPSPSGLTDNWSPVPSPKSRSRSKQGSFSSGSEDDPEDANGFNPSKAQGSIGEKAKGLRGAPAEGQRRRRARSKGRQSSVHDLVDLWGGAKSPTMPTAATKRSSVILPASTTTMKPPAMTNKPRSSSPQPVSTTPAPTGGQSSLQTGGSSPSKHARQPSSQSSSRRLPVPPSTAPAPNVESGSGRSRPSSMFIAPVSKSNAGSLGVASSSEASVAQQALSPPDTPRSRKGTRRSSISDMVHRYETIGGVKGQGPGPPTKPAALSLKTHTSTSSTASLDFPSPSAAATRFPKLSPTTSPVLTKANLAVPEDTGRSQYGRDFAKHRTSPTGLPPRSSPVGRLETPYSSSYTSGPSPTQSLTRTAGVINGLPTQRSPLEPPRDQPSRASLASLSAKGDMGPPPSPRVERKLSAQLEVGQHNANVRSPSPEKPYQGVSRLIDRWQRVVDETEPARRAPPSRAGVAGRS